jgi:ABC-2 type transport system ATP-binding protein
LITVEHLTKKYAGITAVHDISFHVRKHEILGFLGPNGAGKSTTLRILTGYLSATTGTVTIGGNNVFEKPEAVKKIIGYLPENVPLYPELRVEEYLHYRASLKKVPRSKKRSAVNRVIDRCKLGDVQRQIIGQLSKGFRQRVGLADALVGDPEILILDEPTIGLDPNQIREVRNLVRELGKERTVILSSHILPEVEAVCSRVQIIHKGQLISQGKPDELRAGLQGEGVSISVEVRDPDNVSLKILKKIPGLKIIGDPVPGEVGCMTYAVQAEADGLVREQIFDAAVSGGFKLLGLSSKQVSLEDVFVQLTTSEDHLKSDHSEDAKGGEK